MTKSFLQSCPSTHKCWQLLHISTTLLFRGRQDPPISPFPTMWLPSQTPSISVWKGSYQFPSPFCPSSPDTCRCGQVLMAAAEDAAIPTQAVPSSRPSERNPWEQHSPGSRNARSTQLPSRRAQPQEGNAINTRQNHPFFLGAK